MKTLTALCNIVLLGFTCFVLVTDGFPKDAAYIVFTLLLMFIPIFTVFAILSTKGGRGSKIGVDRVAGILNVALLGFVCWALVDQYPHPAEAGVVPFAVLTILTPILSAVVLFLSRLRVVGEGLG